MRTGRYINLLLIPFVALRHSFCVVFLDVELLTFVGLARRMLLTHWHCEHLTLITGLFTYD